jgi:hypothetical protein
VFKRYYEATPRRPRDHRHCGELADFTVRLEAWGERMFTLEKWEADAEAA